MAYSQKTRVLALDIEAEGKMLRRRNRQKFIFKSVIANAVILVFLVFAIFPIYFLVLALFPLTASLTGAVRGFSF